MRIFVFGSNESGFHQGGAAKFAKQNFGAIEGVGFGRMGRSFAIPTKDWDIKTLPLEIINHYVKRFIAYALYKHDIRFDLTKIGCGLAGYTEKLISPLFLDSPANVYLIDKQYSTICPANLWHKNIDSNV